MLPRKPETDNLSLELVARRGAKPLPLLEQLWDLILIELTNWRWSWVSLVVTGMVTPLLSMLALGVFAKDAGSSALAYVFTGNLVISIMFGNQEKVASHFSFVRTQGTLDYFATLPIHRNMLILAVVIAFWLISVPALLVTIVGGQLILNIPLHPHPLLLLVLPLCAIPLSGVGALIAILSRNPAEAGSVNLLFMFLLMGLGAVVIPPDRLPNLLLWLGWINPASYAASALRQLLLSPVTSRIWLDIAALIGFTVLIFAFVGWKMDWRQRS